MEKETDKAKIKLEAEELGSIQIADDVVAMIAAIAAGEVKGVSAMAGNSSTDLKNKVKIKNNTTKGAKVTFAGKNVTIDLAVELDYGYSIPAVSSNVQTKVAAAVESMTGLTCKDVNVHIVGIRV